jgi:hypothetical protein
VAKPVPKAEQPVTVKKEAGVKLESGVQVGGVVPDPALNEGEAGSSAAHGGA